MPTPDISATGPKVWSTDRATCPVSWNIPSRARPPSTGRTDRRHGAHQSHRHRLTHDHPLELSGGRPRAAQQLQLRCPLADLTVSVEATANNTSRVP
ncbi:hypothetical protein SALBM311S_05906 [Streptomyces alboniger]